MILLTWRSDIKLNCLYQKVALRDASKILLKDKFHQIFEEDVSVQNRVGMVKREGDIEQLDRGLHFVNKKIKYVWDPNLQVSHHFFFFLTYVFPTKIKKMLLLAFLHLQAFFKKHIPILCKCSKRNFKIQMGPFIVKAYYFRFRLTPN